MNFDRATATKAQTLNTLKEISGSSKCFPSEKDFQFYYNTFDEFKRPIEEIARKSQSMLQQIGASKHVWGTEEAAFPSGIDDAYEWLVDANEEVLERVEESLNEFKKLMKDEIGEAEWENGLGLVCEKKKKKKKVAEKDKNKIEQKLKIPFHIPTISRPQEKYNIVVNNANQPFQHVWLEKSDDDQRFIHPLVGSLHWILLICYVVILSVYAF